MIPHIDLLISPWFVIRITWSLHSWIALIKYCLSYTNHHFPFVVIDKLFSKLPKGTKHWDTFATHCIGQGDLLSMVLYQFYNADILDTPNTSNEAAAAYVDDAILIVTAKTFEEMHHILTDMMTRQGGAIDWAKAHNSSFELMKLALIDFAHQNKKVKRKSLELQGVDIKPAGSTRYLGVMLDQNLNWKEQEANAAKKGAMWTAQIRRAARSEWGLTPKHAKRLYTSIAIPRTFYAVDMWCSPPLHLGSKHTTNKLRSTQHTGTMAITGGLRTMPTDLLNIHANTFLTHIEIDRLCTRVAVRTVTLPVKHPITKFVEKCANKKVRKHKSPLHLLVAAYNTDPRNFKTIPTAARDPAKISIVPFKIEIAKSKEEAKIKVKENKVELTIYTDGSAHRGNIGTAAVLMRKGKKVKSLRYRLGMDEEHTVFKVEVVGILLGLQLIKMEASRRSKASIGIDNQGILKALKSKLNRVGHYLAMEIVSTATSLRKKKGKGFTLMLNWTAGHIGIEGNKEADKEAKKAVDGDTSNTSTCSPQH